MNLIFRFNLKYSLLKYLSGIFLLTGWAGEIHADNIDSLFNSDEVITMELRSDFSSIQRGRTDSSEYFNGKLIYGSGSGEVELDVKIRARGNFRRNPANCSFPPLMVNFKKSEVANTLFENQNKLKLVTPCQMEEDVIQEYLIYKLYNLVTDRSLKVRLVKIFYFDTGSGQPVFTRYSFFIEDLDRFAERTGSFVKRKFYTPFDLDKDSYIKMTLFQYMVGNKDWFVTSGHNINIMQPNDSTKLPFAVPYDFDFAQFVDAHYSKPTGVPDDYLSNRKVFRGILLPAEEYQRAFEFFNSLEPSFKELVKRKKYLSYNTRNTSFEHIEYFFYVINDKELAKTEIFNLCETRKLYNLPDN